MRKRLAISMTFAALVVAENVDHDVESDVFNAHNQFEGPLIIASEVNSEVGRWEVGDTVSLNQNNQTSVYTYTANGNFVLTSTYSSGGGGGGGGSSSGDPSTGGGTGGGTGGDTGGGGYYDDSGCGPHTYSHECSGGY